MASLAARAAAKALVAASPRGPRPACSAPRAPIGSLPARGALLRALAGARQEGTSGPSVAPGIGPQPPASDAPQVSVSHIVPWGARLPAPASQGPRVLQVQSAAELQHLLACHPQRLLVAHFGAAGCTSDEAFQPALHEACTRFPLALFMRVAVDPIADATLLASLGIGRLPCTLLLRGGQLLARVEARAGEADAAAGALEAALATHGGGAPVVLVAGPR